MSEAALVGNLLWACIKIHPNKIPIPTPPTTIHEKLIKALLKINCPVPIAIKANLKIISEEASFKRLSPSNIVDVVLEIFTNLVMASVLTASGGETIPPNKNPNPSVNPGI